MGSPTRGLRVDGGTAVMGDWRTSVQLTQVDHEIGVKQSSSGVKGYQRRWNVWQNNQCLLKWQAGSTCDG